jgi:ATP adenylyltransferase
MIFDALRQYIDTMQMRHVYQPVMLIELLTNGGAASDKAIAKAILDIDPVQQAYYEDRVRNMVGRVLKDNGITERIDSVHKLIGFEQLTESEVGELLDLCKKRLSEEIDARGEEFWKHRATDRVEIPGTVRQQVFERAKGRCECCGIPKEERPLDIDHIVPRSIGGANDITNYQALCWLCNTTKGNRSTTDFRDLEKYYAERKTGCLFCDELPNTERNRIVAENSLAYVAEDKFPVTKYHRLIIPKRHTMDFFGLEQAELNAIYALLHSQKTEIEKLDSSVKGFNVGMNCGEVAGQSVWHCHVHLLPRREGDVERPRGGVRNIMPGKGDY